MSNGLVIGIILFVFILLAVGFFLYIKNKNTKNKNNTTAPAPARMTAVEVQNIINKYAIKDSNGTPTINYNGGFVNPNLSNFPVADLQKMLQNKWWFAMINDNGPNNLNGYRQGSNGLYVLSFLDKKDPANPINATKSGIIVPVQLSPYLI